MALIHDAVKYYLTQSYRPIPIKSGQKGPDSKNWSTIKILEEEVEHRFSGEYTNVGLVLGSPSGGLVDVDLDCPETASLASKFLPATECTFGRKSKPKGHYAYKCSPVPATRKFLDPDGNAMLVELRGEGLQTVVPPSIHPSGERVEFTPGESHLPSLVPAKELVEAVSKLAAAALLVRHWPDAGGRSLCAMSLGGYLLRGGMNPDEVREFVRTVAEGAGDEEADKRAETVDQTFRKLDQGDNVTGAPSLAEYLGEEVVRRVGQWLGLKQQKPVVTDDVGTNDVANARRIVEKFGQDIRYCERWKRWLVWDGKRWRAEDTLGLVYSRAKDAIRGLFKEVAECEDDNLARELSRWAGISLFEPRIKAAIELAKSEDGVPISPEQLDVDPWLLNCDNGTLNLKTGELQPHCREDFITKIVKTEYDVEAECPAWLQFLSEIMDSDETTVDWLQKAFGYSLTGVCNERVIFILYGQGKNGKSTCLETLREILGDYGTVAAADTLMAKDKNAASNDIAALRGSRFVTASETDNERRLAEATVKQLTGKDTLKARFLYAEFFDFKPTFKIWLATNYKPVIRGMDDGIWDRIRLIPYTVRISEEKRDDDLDTKLLAEAPGILRWLVRGCERWQAEKLGFPEKIRAASAEYRTEMDIIGEFLDDRCKVDPKEHCPVIELYASYTAWCEESGERPLTKRGFGLRLNDRGFQVSKLGGGKSWSGLGLRPTKFTVSASIERTA